MVTRIDTVVVGAGHAGLAVSRLLGTAGRDHVVLDRGRVAEAWRSERWHGLRLLAPNWMLRLPGWHYDGPSPDGFLAVAELVRHLESYAAGLPVETGRTVSEVTRVGDGYRVVTDGRTWLTRHVVVATGATSRASVPADLTGPLPAAAGVSVVSPLRYAGPDRLPAGGVLVVGAGASGVQIAEELALSGRRVVLSVGRHTRLPRRHRGVDTHWWLERTGRLSRTIDTMPDPVRARREPSLQLVGRAPGDPRPADLDLATLQELGVELVGRFRGLDAGRAVVAGADDLAASVLAAEDRLGRFLAAADRRLHQDVLADRLGEWPAAPTGAPYRPRPVRLGPTRESLDLRAEGITSVVAATGYRPHHPWLRVPVVQADGTIAQVRGVTQAPGLYVVGQRFQHRRDSATIDGARHVARDVVTHLCADDARAAWAARCEGEAAG